MLHIPMRRLLKIALVKRKFAFIVYDGGKLRPFSLGILHLQLIQIGGTDPGEGEREDRKVGEKREGKVMMMGKRIRGGEN